MSANRLTRTALTAALIGIGSAVAAPAQAGLLINPQGIFLTSPEQPSFVRDANGQARFGSPAGGFRRFGRSGFFPTPNDPGLPQNGRNAFGAEGRAFEAQPHGEIERKLDGEGFLWGLFD
ncbi:MAG: hypothetical protein AAF415_00625 [Pseudomonadota bacterium]